MIKVCIECGKEIRVKPSHYNRKKYCSRVCKTTYLRKHPPESWSRLSKKTNVNCTNCNKKILRKPSSTGEKNYCSRVCLYEYLRMNKPNQNLRKRIHINCEICSSTFEVIESRKLTAKYCSKKCVGIANGKRGSVQYSKRVKVNCTNCNQRLERKPSIIKQWNFCNQFCMAEYYSKTDAFSGPKSGTWKGGDPGYYGLNWRQQRKKARKRDDFKCQDCGITEELYGQELSVHHIIPFRDFNGDWRNANQLSNLISLCEYPCHRKRHSKSNIKEDFIIYMLSQ